MKTHMTCVPQRLQAVRHFQTVHVLQNDIRKDFPRVTGLRVRDVCAQNAGRLQVTLRIRGCGVLEHSRRVDDHADAVWDNGVIHHIAGVPVRDTRGITTAQLTHKQCELLSQHGTHL